MSKRPFPFDSYTGRQLKVHLNDYENDERVLKDIHERTMTRLIEGSRRLYSGELKITEESQEIDLDQPFENVRNSSQRCITDYFRQL